LPDPLFLLREIAAMDIFWDYTAGTAPDPRNGHIRSRFLVWRLMSVRSRVSVVMTVCCFVVEGVASWTDGVIPICGVLTGGRACSLIVENLVTGFLMCKGGRKLYTDGLWASQD
jgi:hypothetical protein